jgi:hypothetical protein
MYENTGSTKFSEVSIISRECLLGLEIIDQDFEINRRFLQDRDKFRVVTPAPDETPVVC